MKRRKFLTGAVASGALGMVGASSSSSENTEERSTVGFEHIPNKEESKMNTIIHRADSRGFADHGWLKSHHTFSFANYHNPERMNFGVLRVLNDDRVAGGAGFNTHGHQNMEIISIPLEGDLEHRDSMNNVAVIRSGDIQVMSAGTGVQHSEKNKNSKEEVRFLQIWVIPRQMGVEPRYDQLPMADIARKNELYQVLSPNPEDAGVWINQEAWFHMGEFSEQSSLEYPLKKEGNGIYAFVLEGNVEINGEKLNTRDGMGVWNLNSVMISASPNSRILLMEVPMHA